MRIIKNSQRWSGYSVIHQYLIAMITLVIVYLITGHAFPIIAKTRPYSLFLIASYLIALHCGFKPAIFTLLLGFLIANHQFIEPIGHISLPATMEDYADIGVVVLSTIAVLYMIDKYQRARYQNKLLLLVSESRQQILLHRENQRLMLMHKKQVGSKE